MAGLTVARQLGRLDFDISLFEKSRGVGGRMATCGVALAESIRQTQGANLVV